MAQGFKRNTLVVAWPFFHMKGLLALLKTEKLLKTGSTVQSFENATTSLAV